VNLLAEPLKVAAGESPDLVLTLGVSSPSPWVRVRGRFRSADIALGRPVSGYSVVLRSADDAGILQTSAGPDGTFEFPRVIPGAYTVRTNVSPGAESLQVTVGNSNVDDLEIIVPDFVEITGQMTVEGGGKLPPRPTFYVRDSSGVSLLGITGAVMQPSGAFTLMLPIGQFQVVVNPESIDSSGYVVKEMNASDSNTKLRITLAPRP
jgi:hypothetical protein